MDPVNPVVALCADGMAAELRHAHSEAVTLFRQAWDRAGDDYERCIAAHYLARHQDSPAATLEWNQRCLELALSVDDERVAGFFPSLYLNIGHSHEMLDDPVSAAAHYRAAADHLDVVADDDYGRMLRDGITRALARVTTTASPSDRESP